MTKSHGRQETELEQHHEASFGWALACVDWNREEAEEVLQAAYLKVLDGSARYAGRSGFKTWLFAVIRRTAAERRRRARVRSLALARFASREVRPPGASPEGTAEGIRAGTRLAAALGELSSRQREVLHLVFYGDFTIEQAAAVMGVGVGSARTHYTRGKDRLRLLLEDGE